VCATLHGIPENGRECAAIRGLRTSKTFAATVGDVRLSKRQLGSFVFSSNANRYRIDYKTISLIDSFRFQTSRLNKQVTELWLDDMYLRNQVPLPVNSNPAFLFPRQRFDTIDSMLRFAAQFVQFAVQFKRQIDRQLLSQDSMKGTCNCCRSTSTSNANSSPMIRKCYRSHLQSLCMQTYRHFFTAYRTPGFDKDTLTFSSGASNHIAVACRNQVRSISSSSSSSSF
jgi:hypothetical protein